MVSKSLSTPRVVLQPTRRWDPETGIMDKTPSFNADLYIICYFNADDYDTADPLDLTQWEFYVLTRKTVRKIMADRKSLSLKLLKKLGIKSTNAHRLAAKVKNIK